jgi:hypothetical protein
MIAQPRNRPTSSLLARRAHVAPVGSVRSGMGLRKGSLYLQRLSPSLLSQIVVLAADQDDAERVL